MIDIEFIDEVNLGFDIRSVQNTLDDVLTKLGDNTNYSIEFLLVSEDKIQKLNNQYFQKDYPTDVLTGWSIGFIWISLLWLWFRHNQSGKNNLFLDKNLNEVEQ